MQPPDDNNDGKELTLPHHLNSVVRVTTSTVNYRASCCLLVCLSVVSDVPWTVAAQTSSRVFSSDDEEPQTQGIASRYKYSIPSTGLGSRTSSPPPLLHQGPSRTRMASSISVAAVKQASGHHRRQASHGAVNSSIISPHTKFQDGTSHHQFSQPPPTQHQPSKHQAAPRPESWATVCNTNCGSQASAVENNPGKRCGGGGGADANDKGCRVGGWPSQRR